MSLAQIQLASADQFKMEKENAAQVVETTPRAITPVIETFVAELGCDTVAFVPVVADRHGLYGWCSDGVLEKVKADSGACIFGWTIWEWSNVMLTAEFHAVWENEAGILQDITPKPKGEKQILFVPDRRYSSDFNFDLRPRNRRTRLFVGNNPVNEVAQAMSKLSGAKLQYEAGRARKAGLNLENWLLAKVQPHPFAVLIDQLISTCAEFEEHFDSLGASGSVAVDLKFQTLAQRRLALQKEVKRQAGRVR